MSGPMLRMTVNQKLLIQFIENLILLDGEDSPTAIIISFHLLDASDVPGVF